MTKYLKIILSFIIIVSVTACVEKPSMPPAPTSLKEATTKIINNLLWQLDQERSLLKSFEKTTIVLSSFYNKDTGETIVGNKFIEEIILNESRKKSFNITKVNSENLETADYLIQGYINLKNYHISLDNEVFKKYRISAYITQLGSEKIIAWSDVWIDDKNLDEYLKPIPAYKDSPMFDTKSKQRHKLKLDTILTEADRFYDNNDYKNALSYYRKAEEISSDEPVMRVYIGLYNAYIKLKKIQDAEQVFGELINVAVASSNLNLKFLFKVNKKKFIKSNELEHEYDIWLRQLGKYFASSDKCVIIEGHTSKTGDAEYNNKLSLQRAKTVRDLLKKYFAKIEQKSKIIGKGFSETIVGSGNDNVVDAIDRRVEFEIVSCAKLNMVN
jgi:outer membrane protein OmpA-like peptidoglycan-associated protein